MLSDRGENQNLKALGVANNSESYVKLNMADPKWRAAKMLNMLTNRSENQYLGVVRHTE